MLTNAYPVIDPPPDPLKRRLIEEPISVGVRCIDGVLTCGKGQRMGIFAAAGGGKSTLLGMIARNAVADVNVISLIGERGREVREFLRMILGEEGMKRSVVIVSTSDQAAQLRLNAAYVGTAIAEYFRDQGKTVILMMDSVTRFARALREIGLAAGEPPARAGFTPSVFATLPRLLERSGNSEKGPSQLFTPSWSPATTSMSRSPMRRDRFSTATSSCPSSWPGSTTILRSMSWLRSAES